MDYVPTLTMTAVQAWVRVGSGDEDKRHEAGLAHAIEHMLFKGSAEYPDGALSGIVESVGGTINAWTSYDETVFHMVIPPDMLKTALRPFVDAVFHPVFDADELEKEKSVILEEIRHGHDSPSHRTYDALFRLGFRGTRYGEPIIGTSRSVSSFTPKVLHDFHNRWYLSENITFIVASPFPADEVLDAFRELDSMMRVGSAPMREESPYTPPRSGYRVESGTFSDIYMAVAMPTERYTPELAALADMTAVILGEGETSRLVHRLQHRDELVLRTYAWNYLTPHAGMFILTFIFSPSSDPAAVVSAAHDEMKRLLSDLHPSEVEKARTIIQSEQIESLQTAQGIAKRRGYMYFEAGDPLADRQYMKAVQSIDAQGIVSFVKGLLERHKWYAGVAAPEGKDKSFSKDTFRPFSARRKLTAPVRHENEPVEISLSNGSTLVVLQEHTLPWVCMRAGWRGGLLTERRDVAGISILMADLMTRGTKLRSGDRLNREIEARGGILTGFSGRNSLGARVDIMSQFWEEGMEALWEVLTQPSWPSDELERLRRRAIESIRAEEDHHSYQTTRLLEKSIYGSRHPYGLPVHGSEESLASLTRKKIESHWNRWYKPHDLTISVIGDVIPELVQEKLEHFISSLPSRTESAPHLPLQFNKPPVRRRAYKQRDISQDHIMLGALAVAITDKGRAELDVLASILGGMSGRLFTDLRDRRSLAYHVTAASLEGLAPGYFTTYIVTRPDMAHEALEGLREHVALLREKEVEDSELQRAVARLIGMHKNGLQRRSAMAATLLYSVMYGMGFDFFLGYDSMLRKVTPGSILEAARHYLSEERLVTAVYGPRKL